MSSANKALEQFATVESNRHTNRRRLMSCRATQMGKWQLKINNIVFLINRANTSGPTMTERVNTNGQMVAERVIQMNKW